MAGLFVSSHIAKDLMSNPLVSDELNLLHTLVNLDQHRHIIELGCGAAGLARKLLARFPGCEITGLEVDARQHAKNLRDPLPGLQFIQAGAQAIPLAS
jgi:trans-aconitate methyltransferase